MIDFLRFFTVSIILLGFVLKLSFNGSWLYINIKRLYYE